MKIDELREYIYIYIYIYMCVCGCVCVWVKPDMHRQLCLGVSVEELMDLGYYGRHVLNVFIQ